MNRELAQAVIATFYAEDAQRIEQLFAPFEDHDWTRMRRWLHTSGLALRFLDRVTKLGAISVVPAVIVHEHSINLEENRVRTADLFEEFAEVNSAFQRSGALYANLKGFTLVPAACADPALRYQHDLDFLVSRRDAERCRQALVQFGYQQTAVFENTWEFRAGGAEICSMRELYRVRAQRSLELHLLPESEEECSTNRLSRLQLQSWRGFEFPALSECDKLLSQAMHLFKHFQTEWTRTAWLLEYATTIRTHQGHKNLWQDVKSALNDDPAIQVGVGMASLISGRTFGLRLPRELMAAVETLPTQVRLWTDRYEQELVFAEHPGTKLYLMLKDILLADNPAWQCQRRRRLLPTRLPPKTMAAKSDSLRVSWRVQLAQLRFVLRRLRFHIGSGVHYRFETIRWRRFLAGVQ